MKYLTTERSNPKKLLAARLDDNGYLIELLEYGPHYPEDYKHVISFSMDIWQLQDLRDCLNQVIDYMISPPVEEINYNDLE